MQQDRTDRRPRTGTFARAGWTGLVLLTCLRVWLGDAAAPPEARAQLANPAAQRQETVHEIRRTNELLIEIRDLLKKGTLHVRLEGADNQSGASLDPRGADR